MFETKPIPFLLYTEYSGYKAGQIIQNNRSSKLLIISTYRVWWKEILKFFGINLYKAPYIYKVILTYS